MKHKLTALLAALALAATSIAPAAADPRDGRRDGYGRHYGQHDDYRRGRHYRGRDDHGDAVAAGVVGLVLGLALGAAANSPDRRDARNCRDNYRRCDPPPGYYQRRDSAYGQQDGYYEDGYDPRYDDRRSAYEDDYGRAPPTDLRGGRGGYDDPPCIRRERQWDRYANRYVTVDVPC